MRHTDFIGTILDALPRWGASALLLLALAGYCGLPSNPPTDLFHADWFRLTGSGHAAAPGGLAAPTQNKEYRARDKASIAALQVAPKDEPDPGKAALPPAAAFVPEPACDGPAFCGAQPAHADAGLLASRPSRGPPLA